LQTKERGLKSRQKQLLATILLALVSWVIPFAGIVTLPLQYLYTHLHEMGHALVSQLTGGSHVQIIVFANGSGLTFSQGGSQLLVSPAGYVGATAMGALVLYMSRSADGSRNALKMISILLGIGLVVWIRGDIIGIATAVLGCVGLWIAANSLKGDALVFAGQFLGAFLSLASLQAVISIMGISSVSMQENDAVILEKVSGIPAPLSALVWAAVSVMVVAVALIRAWKHA
jgi:hypothetical protein